MSIEWHWLGLPSGYIVFELLMVPFIFLDYIIILTSKNCLGFFHCFLSMPLVCSIPINWQIKNEEFNLLEFIFSRVETHRF
jgi:hypothetical protein